MQILLTFLDTIAVVSSLYFVAYSFLTFIGSIRYSSDVNYLNRIYNSYLGVNYSFPWFRRLSYSSPFIAWIFARWVNS